jgi:hypothetical protein
MPTTPPTDFDRAAALEAAQQQAYENAQAAQKHHAQAAEQTQYADARAGSDYLRQAVAEARQEAQRHSVCTTEAARLADMWARVAVALAAGTDTRTATYDLNVQLDPKSDGEELVRLLRESQSRQGGLGG